jgi:hypothetical protein
LITAAGLFAVFAWPQIAERRSGTEKARLLVFNRDDGGWERGWRPVQIDLSPSDNPVRIILDAKFAADAIKRGVTTDLLMVVARGGAVLLETALAMPVPGSGDGGPHGTVLPVPEFSVPQAGRYTITIRSTETEDAGFLGADAIVRTGVARDPDRWQVPGYVATGLGAVLFILGGGRINTGRRGRRRKRRR